VVAVSHLAAPRLENTRNWRLTSPLSRLNLSFQFGLNRFLGQTKCNNLRSEPIVRRPTAAPPSREGPRINRMITVPKVLVIASDGEKLGVVDTDSALAMAEEEGLDLVEVSPNASPPVCKILDYGKLKYQEQKKASEARKRQKTVDVKEIKMRPNIDTHDYQVKMRSVNKFLNDGDKVKVTMRFRGREMAHQNLGMELLHKVRDETSEIAKVEAMPKLEGRQMVMVLGPR